jgi:iron complex outermembrane recepter protein
VLTPRWIDDLSLSVDWFKIDVDDAIAARSAQQILDACANLGGANCNLVQRDPVTGQVLQLLQSVSNFEKVEVEGVDFTLRYGFDAGPGRINTVFDASRLIHFTNRIPQPDGTIVEDKRAGKSDRPRSTLPNWKATGSVRYLLSDWEFGWRGRYIGGSDDVPDNFVNDGRTGSAVFHDVQLVYHLHARDMSFTLGVDNVTDKVPPASRANAPINFDIYTYDARGTFIYLRAFMAF